MIPLLTLALFLLLSAVFVVLGMKVWVRPKAAIDRVTGSSVEQVQLVAHPSLAWRDLVKKFSSLAPASPKSQTRAQQQLSRAGFRNPTAVKFLFGSKVLGAVLLPLIATGILWRLDIESNNKMFAVVAAVPLGFVLPSMYVGRKVKKRQKHIAKGLPNALDLMVVCVESGLGLDQTIVQVAKELQFAHPEISQEYFLTNLELKAGKRRAEALRNLAQRNSVGELKQLVAVLIQADRFGTSISQTLRGHSDFMRVQVRQRAEEKAAKLGVKLVFPIFFCILPSLFVVTVGPVLIRIIRDLLPMMNNM